MAFLWLIDWGDPNYLRSSWDDPPSSWGCFFFGGAQVLEPN